MSSAVTTHVLDAARGAPAQGIPVRLERLGLPGGATETLAVGVTDSDGRIGALGPERLEPGTYRLAFDTLTYFAAQGVECFYPEVVVTALLSDPNQHYHLPLLLSPYSYSTYRGT
jgi:5-hydroxyisourate hydrolase